MGDSQGGAQRRVVRYRTLAELEADAQRLAEVPVRTVGNWSYGQILQHLAVVTNCAFDGFGFEAPWFARKLIAPWVKNSLLTKPMSAGFKLPARARTLLPEDVPLDEALDNLRRALGRFASETPTARHPFLGALASQEWESLALRHAELHMSFVIPAEA
jgi:hypothetical protein